MRDIYVTLIRMDRRTRFEASDAVYGGRLDRETPRHGDWFRIVTPIASSEPLLEHLSRTVRLFTDAINEGGASAPSK